MDNEIGIAGNRPGRCDAAVGEIDPRVPTALSGALQVGNFCLLFQRVPATALCFIEGHCGRIAAMTAAVTDRPTARVLNNQWTHPLSVKVRDLLQQRPAAVRRIAVSATEMLTYGPDCLMDSGHKRNSYEIA
jgi:hypothetical protein